MTTATALAMSLVCACAGLCAAAQDDAKPAAFACNLKAISAAERPRYNELSKRVRESVRERIEISNGYQFKLDSRAVTLPEVAEWMAMERLCCPFLTLQLSAAGNQSGWTLGLTGAEGVKPLLESAFPAR
jgi:hypothetical protein